MDSGRRRAGSESQKRTRTPCLRVLGWAALSIVCLTTPLWPQETKPVVTIDAPAQPQPASRPIDLKVVATGVANLAAFELDLEYDPSLIRQLEVFTGTFLGNTAQCNPKASRCVHPLRPVHGKGIVHFGAVTYGAGAGASGEGPLAVLRLQPSGKAGVIKLHIRRVLLADTSANTTIPERKDVELALTAN
jgi:hypothetical protein